MQGWPWCDGYGKDSDGLEMIMVVMVTLGDGGWYGRGNAGGAIHCLIGTVTANMTKRELSFFGFFPIYQISM